jgi:hypothetical protein
MSKKQLDSILIKPLDRVKFLKLRTKIRLIDIDGHNQVYKKNVKK